MREIKFRAYITYGYTTQELHDPGLLEEIQETGLGFIDTPDLIDFKNQRIKYDSEWYERDRFRLIQSTGLKDTNGKEIDEGDILKGNYHFKGEGWFDTGEGDYKICSAVEFRNGKFICQSFNVGEMTDFVEVIGNIYENPELMEGKDGC